MNAPRTRAEETEFYLESGTFDHEAERDYQPDESDEEFDLSEDDDEEEF